MPNAEPTRSKPYGDGWPRITSGSWQTSPPGISTPASLGARAQADRDLAQHLGVGLLDGDVVEQRERLGPDADEVVDVHRDAVDPDRVEAAGLLGDDHLRADAVGGERDPEPGRDPQHARVVPGQRHGERATRPGSIPRSTSTSAATPASAWRVSTPAAAYASRHAHIVLDRPDGRRPRFRRVRAPQLGRGRARRARSGRPRTEAASGRARPDGSATSSRASRRTTRCAAGEERAAAPGAAPAGAGAPP